MSCRHVASESIISNNLISLGRYLYNIILWLNYLVAKRTTYMDLQVVHTSRVGCLMWQGDLIV